LLGRYSGELRALLARSSLQFDDQAATARLERAADVPALQDHSFGGEQNMDALDASAAIDGPSEPREIKELALEREWPSEGWISVPGYLHLRTLPYSRDKAS